MKTPEMEVALAYHFNYRTHLIVPNISWGLGIHECDLLVMTPSGYLTEVEIKVSKADLKKDSEKWHEHKSNKIKRLFFAVPDAMDIEFVKANVPERAGIIVVKENRRCKIIRHAKINSKAVSISEKDRQHLAHLGCMRIWSLKEKLYYKRMNKRGK